MFAWMKKSQPAAEQAVPDAPPQFEINVDIHSDVGCVREVNEDAAHCVQPDAVLLAQKGVLVMVADGMGGHAAGEVASGLAVEVISRVYYEAAGTPEAALRQAFEKANHAIYHAASHDPSRMGMGTTGTALVLRGGLAHAAHVGDSRLYLLREGAIYAMTEDHSAVGEMVKQGLISAEAARHHPHKNVILRALGTAPRVEVALWDEPFPLRAGDYFLLCSDGLYDLVEDEEILQAMLDDPSGAGPRLIELAKERGGHDNITVVLAGLAPLGTAEEDGEAEGQAAPVSTVADDLPETREMKAVS